MKWIVENEIIVGDDEGTKVYPSTSDIYSATDTICIGNKNYPFEVNLDFFKLIPLSVEILFSVENGSIKCCAFASIGNERIAVTNTSGYVIANNVWYYLDPSIEILFSALNSMKCTWGKEITYFQYIEVTNILRKNDISFFDDVIPYLEEIKHQSFTTNVAELNNTFFPYQKSGVNWLSFMSNGNCGCILGDEMGLGKTLQIIGLFLSRKKELSESKLLVVAPLSLLVNWEREIIKFAPALKPHIHHGTNRTGFYTELLNYDVIITSYTTVQSDLSMFRMIEWDVLVLDEAQNIKNPSSKRRTNINELRRRMTVAVTGTPFENHVTDVWSIADFVIPGYFGSLSDFEHTFGDDIISAKSIEKMLSPVMIRRLVQDVANDLPEKVTIPQGILMTEDEAKYYESERNQLSGAAALGQVRIDLIQGLRMFCSHPRVYRDDLNDIDPILLSNKYARTCEIIDEAKQYGDKILIFTSFNKMIHLFVDDISSRFGIPVGFINGEVPAEKRQQIIDEFSNIKGSAVLVLNPKVAGAGLNITCANRVIHYNFEWNPAIEAQATARAYRRGQKQTVFVYRLFYSGTIEEFINDKIEHKQELFDDIVVGNKGDINSSELVKALSYSPREELQ